MTRSVYFLILAVYLSYLGQVLLPITLANNIIIIIIIIIIIMIFIEGAQPAKAVFSGALIKVIRIK